MSPSLVPTVEPGGVGALVFAGVATFSIYSRSMRFRDRLLASIRAMQPILEIPGVMIGGSQVPNLLEPDMAATLVVSQDVDLVIPVSRHSQVKEVLEGLRGYTPSSDEPSVWLPDDEHLLEMNFIGLDPSLRESSDTYVLDDERLPLLVFGLLSHLQEGMLLRVGDFRARLPRPAGLMIEKLLTERAGLKGQRDLLVALGLLLVSRREDIDEIVEHFAGLSDEQRKIVIGSLTILSLMASVPDMPDPARAREEIATLIERLETIP